MFYSRKIIIGLFGCFLGLLGCQAQIPTIDHALLESEVTHEVTSATDPEEKVTIALVMKTLTNPFFVEMEKGARLAEAEYGVELLVRTASEETSIEQQIAIVESLIHDDVNAIVIAPGDSVELVPVLKQAQEAGITIVNIDNQLDLLYSQQIGLHNIPFISVDNENAAYLSAKYISDQITRPSKVAILEGIRSAKNAESRKQGALRAFKENPNVTEIVMETANWKIDEAYQISKQLLMANPDIKAIFCANDMMALGAIQYLYETQRTDVLVAGFDALEEALAAIHQGSLAVTIDQQAAEQGYLGVSYAVQILQGKSLPAEVMVDARVITAETVEGSTSF
jgi:ribose transport system substrate-binding protein